MPDTARPAQAALRYWEEHRVYYNLILLAIVGLTLVLRRLLGEETPWQFTILVQYAIAANLCFTTAYIVDLVFRRVLPPTGLTKARNALFYTGCAIAIFVACTISIAVFVPHF